MIGIPRALVTRGILIAAMALTWQFTFAEMVVGDGHVEPLLHGHAHNDYWNERPLLDALKYGFISVEADIFLKDGKLLVGHDEEELTPQKTLQALYLDPLKKRVQANNGSVYKTPSRFYLLIDIKSAHRPAFVKLSQVLANYESVLSKIQGDVFTPGAITVVLSGSVHKGKLVLPQRTFVSLDGRLSDLDKDVPNYQMPLISDRWSSHFRWRGKGPFPPDEKARLHEIVRKAHQKGRMVRFWDTPESERVWQELLHAQVDLINTDELSRFSRFFQNRKSARATELSGRILSLPEESPFFLDHP